MCSLSLLFWYLSIYRFFFPANILSHMDELDEPIENQEEFTAIMMVCIGWIISLLLLSDVLLCSRHLAIHFCSLILPSLRKILNIWSR